MVHVFLYLAYGAYSPSFVPADILPVLPDFVRMLGALPQEVPGLLREVLVPCRFPDRLFFWVEGERDLCACLDSSDRSVGP